MTRLSSGSLALALLFAAPARAADTSAVTGVWHAALVPTPDKPVGCLLTIAATGGALSGSIRNGTFVEPLSRVEWDGTTLRLFWDHYDSKVEATLGPEGLAGTYALTRPNTTIELPFAATRAAPPAPKAPKGPGVGGEWAVAIGDDTKLKAVFTQKGSAVTGTILSDTGDYGPLHGTFDGSRLTLQVFNGFFCYRVDATLVGEALQGEFRSRKNEPAAFTATRKKTADPAIAVSLKDPGARLRFSLPDANGVTISSDDARYRGKALVATVMGTWCPNCHDEAPVLADLARRYGPKGLEVVAFAFEYTDDVERSRRQMKRFAERYGVGYPTLLAGTTKDAASSAVLSQLQGWKGYPTTLFFDRAGKLVAAHSGFDGPGTGARFEKAKKEMEQTVRKILR